MIEGRSDLLIWQYSGIGTTSFLGSSDEFPATSFEAVVQQGTPCGTYTVSFREDTFINDEECLASEMRGLTIIVTDNVPETTTTAATTTTTTAATTTTTTTTTMTTTTTTASVTTTETEATATTTTTTTTETTTAVTTTEVTTTSEALTTTGTTEKITVVYENPYLSHSGIKLYEGMCFQLAVYNAYGDVKWQSTDEEIASVSENGMVTANGVGTCKIYALVRGKLLFCNVSVIEGLCGDVDLNNDVSLIDAVWLNKYLAKKLELNPVSLNNADCFADGTITAEDVRELLRYLVMLADDLPVIPDP